MSMDGDITRNTFDPSKGYSSVRGQQGRVQLDADANEAVDIALHDERIVRGDLIGPHGAPEGAPGMQVTTDGASLHISPGRYYVDGIRCEHQAEAPVTFDAQPHLPDAALPTGPGLYLVYLDVWEQRISAIQDPEIREVALGGPDTTTRTKVIWQVKTLAVSTDDTNPSCATPLPEWDRLRAGPTGTLQVRVAAAAEAATACVVPETAGYRGLQNQLYRFQIHGGNFEPAATDTIGAGTTSFKWSRDNGSVIASWLGTPTSNLVSVDRLGPGGANGFEDGQWVELTDDDDDLLARPGVVARIDEVKADRLALTDATAAVGVPDLERHPQVRRWDSAGLRATASAPAEADTTEDGWIRVEDGIEIKFGAGSFRSGDHWIMPARTAVLPGSEDAQIDWPRIGNVPVALRPMGPRHHYAKLALASFDGSAWTVVDDCRRLFPPLTELTELDMRGGDGQHARSGHWLPAPIRVGVGRGDTPVSNAWVRFTVQPRALGAGTLSPTEPDAAGNAAGSASNLDVQTNAEGIAQVWWRLGPAPGAEVLGDDHQPQQAQHVDVTLLDHEKQPTNVATRFSAQTLDNVTLTPAGGDGQIGKPGDTLEIAMRVRVADGSRPIEGAHVLFQSLSRMFDGENLDQITGGSIHASANVVSFTPWPGGNRMLEAVVQTDDEGMAQVQAILGTHTGLTVQRVQATLLDEHEQPTSQTALFTAHLAIAEEIAWKACKALLPFLRPDAGHDVQAALDALCKARQQDESFYKWVLDKVRELQAALENDPGDSSGRFDFDLNNLDILRRALEDPTRYIPSLVLPPIDPSPVGPTPPIPRRPPLRPGAALPTEPTGEAITPTPPAAPEPTPTPSPTPDRVAPGGTVVARRPITDVRAVLVAADDSFTPIGPDTEISASQLTAIEVRPPRPFPDMVPPDRGQLGLAVYVETAMRSGAGQPAWGYASIRLAGTSSFQSDRATWTPLPTARSWLQNQLRTTQEAIAAELVVDASAVGGDPEMPTWRRRLWITP